MKIYTYINTSGNGSDYIDRNLLSVMSKYTNDPEYYIHFAKYQKFGLNPKSRFYTPNGIYCYNLHRFSSDIDKALEEYNNTSVQERKTINWAKKVFPFATHQPYLIIFKKLNLSDVLFAQRAQSEDIVHYAKSRIAKFVHATIHTPLATATNIVSILANSSNVTAPYKPSKHRIKPTHTANHHVVFVWRLSRIVSFWVASVQMGLSKDFDNNYNRETYHSARTDLQTVSLDDYEQLDEYEKLFKTPLMDNPVMPLASRVWANIFRYLGFEGVHDEGAGLIHPNEPAQAVFFSIKGLELTEIVLNQFVNSKNAGSESPSALSIIKNMIDKGLYKDPKVVRYILADKKTQISKETLLYNIYKAEVDKDNKLTQEDIRKYASYVGADDKKTIVDCLASADALFTSYVDDPDSELSQHIVERYADLVNNFVDTSTTSYGQQEESSFLNTFFNLDSYFVKRLLEIPDLTRSTLNKFFTSIIEAGLGSATKESIIERALKTNYSYFMVYQNIEYFLKSLCDNQKEVQHHLLKHGKNHIPWSFFALIGQPDDFIKEFAASLGDFGHTFYTIDSLFIPLSNYFDTMNRLSKKDSVYSDDFKENSDSETQFARLPFSYTNKKLQDVVTTLTPDRFIRTFKLVVNYYLDAISGNTEQLDFVMPCLALLESRVEKFRQSEKIVDKRHTTDIYFKGALGEFSYHVTETVAKNVTNGKIPDGFIEYLSYKGKIYDNEKASSFLQGIVKLKNRG